MIHILYYDRIDYSEGIDVKETSQSKECNICQYWYFLDKASQFQPDVCNGSHDLLTMSLSLNDVAILKIHGHGVDVLIVELAKQRP